MQYSDALPLGMMLVDEFELNDVLGQGGFGITYRATDVALRRQVAIKEYFPEFAAYRGTTLDVMPRSEQAEHDLRIYLEKFISEAQILASLPHPNIVRVNRVFSAFRTAYIVLDYVEGQNLEQWLTNLGRIPTQEELDFLCSRLLDALDIVHRNKIVHRDIKPDNIYIRAVDKSPVLLDFGSARPDAALTNRASRPVVSEHYSPLEAYGTGNLDVTVDIYGFAATLYRAIVGQPPPTAIARYQNEQIYSLAALAPEGFRPEFLHAVDRGLALNARYRPQSVPEWRREISPGAAGLRTADRPLGSTTAPPQTGEIQPTGLPGTAMPSASPRSWPRPETAEGQWPASAQTTARTGGFGEGTVQGATIPGTMAPGTMIPGTMIPGTMVQGAMVQGETKPLPVAPTPAGKTNTAAIITGTVAVAVALGALAAYQFGGFGRPASTPVPGAAPPLTAAQPSKGAAPIVEATGIDSALASAIDVVIVIDTTRDAKPWLPAVATGVNQFVVQNVARLGPLRMGLVFYRDYTLTNDCNIEYVTKWGSELSNSIGADTAAKVSTALGAETTTRCGSDEEQEAVLDAVNKALTETDWKSRNKRVVLVIAGASGHSLNDQRKNPLRLTVERLRELADKAVVRVDVLLVSPDPSPTADDLAALATNRGGRLKGTFSTFPTRGDLVSAAVSRALASTLD